MAWTMPTPPDQLIQLLRRQSPMAPAGAVPPSGAVPPGPAMAFGPQPTPQTVASNRQIEGGQPAGIPPSPPSTTPPRAGVPIYSAPPPATAQPGVEPQMGESGPSGRAAVRRSLYQSSRKAARRIELPKSNTAAHERPDGEASCGPCRRSESGETQMVGAGAWRSTRRYPTQEPRECRRCCQSGSQPPTHRSGKKSRPRPPADRPADCLGARSLPALHCRRRSGVSTSSIGGRHQPGEPGALHSQEQCWLQERLERDQAAAYRRPTEGG